ncbi:11762_t:CDS:2, partial [Funneliformis mosseae]
IPTLYSCSLVNKRWNENAIPYLWENPFRYLSWESTDSNKILAIENLPNTTGNILEEDIVTSQRCKKELNLIVSHDMLNQPLFNYAKYLKYLDIDRIITTIRILFDNYTFSKESERQVETKNNSIILSTFSYLKNKHESSFCEFFSNVQEFECTSVYPSNEVFDLFRKHSSNVKSFIITMEKPDLLTYSYNSEVGI